VVPSHVRWQTYFSTRLKEIKKEKLRHTSKTIALKSKHENFKKTTALELF
jgi:hypothetical protein